MKFWSVFLSLVLLLAGTHAEAAKRLGGGKSVGQQSSNVSKREAAAPTQAAPANAATAQPTAAKPGTPPAAAPTPAPKPWGAMLGGLAAGLGLAWLAHSLGFGAEFGQFLLMGLVALAIMMAIGWFMRRRNQAQEPVAVRSPYAFEGASAGSSSATTAPDSPKQYNPANIGNDASARPWERQSMAFEAPQKPQGSMIGSALQSPLSGPQTWGIPAGFDAQGFVEAAKRNFITLQAAWDKSDIATLRSMMTDEMLSEIQSQLSEREKIQTSSAIQTEVAMLEAQLLGIEELPSGYMASVEFSGMIREDAASGPAPFREVWNMTKSKDGSSGWLVAGLQALQ